MNFVCRVLFRSLATKTTKPPLKDLDLSGRIILKWRVKCMMGSSGLDLFISKYGLVAAVGMVNKFAFYKLLSVFVY